MKNKYRNIFLLFGIAAIIIMLLSFDMDYKEVWHNLKKAGYWFPAILLLWVFIYMVNALSWYNIIRDGEKSPISYLKVYKLTITGFALNYATPGGLMGGEPYRAMELTPYVGASKATSSVILYVMMHIFSHICFWFASIFLYIILYPVNAMLGAIFAITGFVLLFLIYLFLRGYSKGMAVKTIHFLGYVPFAKNWARRFSIEKRETLEKIDSQIAELHKQRKITFYSSLGLELLARVMTCVEVYFILNILTTNVSFPSCILIMAFTSLFANIFFFSPMQLGAREGGFAIAVAQLSISSAYGVYTGLISRLRELIWIIIGVALMKVGTGVTKNKKEANKLIGEGLTTVRKEEKNDGD